MKPEEIVEEYLKKEAKKRKFICMKFVSPGTNGVPDRIVIGNGYTVFIETKRKDGKPRALQEKIMKQMKNAGAIVYVADSKKEIDGILDKMEKGSV